jgi:mannose-6-phosphate isomerase
MNELYPLKFKPLFKERIWGGNKILTSLGLDFSPLQTCGEAWILSGVPGSQTKVTNGFLKGNELNELVEIYMDDLVGEKAFSLSEDIFPILIKFIDSNDWLSIQVHPDDELAAKRKIGSGKSEMWYVMEAEPGAELISGFSRETTRNNYLEMLKQNRLKELLNTEKVHPEDVFFIPAGRVHALGPGILLAEIQQTSDTTYRMYDWNRTDAEGKSRELHTDLALEAIDFKVYDSYRVNYRQTKNHSDNLVSCPAFTTNLLNFDQPVEKEFSYLDSFVIYLCVEGEFEVAWTDGRETVNKGEVILLPAILERALLLPRPGAKILEIYLT